MLPASIVDESQTLENMFSGCTSLENIAAPTDTFSDCSEECVLKAYKIGVVQGIGNGEFDPSGKLDRESLATMLGRALEYIAKENGEALHYNSKMEHFSDNKDVSSWAYAGIDLLSGIGVLNGVSGANGEMKLAPKMECEIQQCVVLAYRALDYLGATIKIS